MDELLEFKSKLQQQLSYEKREVMIERLKNAIGYLEGCIQEIKDSIRDMEWNCERILSGKQ